MKKLKIFLFFSVLLFLNACSKNKAVTTIKLAHSLDVTHPVHKAMVFMSDRVNEKSKGEMIVDIYPGGQLGNERELIELLQIVFWFHPLIYVLKHHVKLNHEFLADDAVLQEGSDTKTYQNIFFWYYWTFSS